MKKFTAVALRGMAAISFTMAFVAFFVTEKATLGEIKAPKDFR